MRNSLLFVYFSVFSKIVNDLTPSGAGLFLSLATLVFTKFEISKHPTLFEGNN